MSDPTPAVTPTTPSAAPETSAAPPPAGATSPAAAAKPAETDSKPKPSILGGVPEDDAAAKAKADQGQKGAEGEKPKGPDGEIPVKWPDGVTIDKSTLDEFAKLAKEIGLTSETASKVAAWYVANYDKSMDDIVQHMAKMDEQRNAEWSAELHKDPDFADEVKTKAAEADARRGVIWAGGPALSKAMHELGIGNHPLLVKAFVRIGRAIAEDNSGGAAGGKPGGPPSREEELRRFYDHKAA